MRDNIPSTLRAGQGGPSTPTAGNEAEMDDMTRTLMSLSVALVSRAGDCAATYAEHAGRFQVCADDVKIAMQYQAKVFFDQVTDDEVTASRADVDRACDSEDSSDDSSDEEEEADDSEAAETEEEVAWSRSACPCVQCVGMNEAHDTWDAWAPEDEALQYLRGVTAKYLASVAGSS